MPSAVRVVFTADDAQFERSMGKMVAIAEGSGKTIGQRYAAGVASGMSFSTFTGKGGAGGGGFFSRMGTAGSMFTSVARDSAASLASGAPINQVIAQQAPQVLQALTMMRLGMVALQVSVIAAAAAVTAYLAKAFYDSYFEVQRTLEVTKQLEKALVTMAQRRADKRLSDILEGESEVKKLKLAKELLKNQNEAADAAAELDKQRMKADFFANKLTHTKKEELALEEKLLAVDLQRAEEKAKQLQDAESARKIAIKEAEIQLKKANDAYDEAHAKDRAYGGYEGKAPVQVSEFDQLKLVAAIDDAQAALDAANQLSDQAGMDHAMSEVLRIKNQISALKEQSREIKTSAKEVSNSVTERQRIGAFSGGANSMLEIQKKSEGHLRDIRDSVKRLVSGGSF